jgi:hypothetical protein
MPQKKKTSEKVKSKLKVKKNSLAYIVLKIKNLFKRRK